MSVFRRYTFPMLRALAACIFLALSGVAFGQSQDEAVLLIAHPAFRDLEYRQTCLLYTSDAADEL